MVDIEFGPFAIGFEMKTGVLVYEDGEGRLTAEGVAETKPIWGLNLENPLHFGFGGIVAAGGDVGIAWGGANK